MGTPEDDELVGQNSVDIFSRTDLTVRDVKQIEKRGVELPTMGQTGYITDVTDELGLTEAQVQKLSNENGRKVSNRVYLKSSFSTHFGEFPLSEAVRRDAEMRKNPRVKPFAVLASPVYTDTAWGENDSLNDTRFFMEFAEGVNPDVLDLPPDTFKPEDSARILFQLCQVAQAYNADGLSIGDTLKDLRYLTDEKPPRVLLFDLSYYYLDSQDDQIIQNDERLKMNDREILTIQDETKSLADHFSRTMKRADRTELQPILEKMQNGEYGSFAETSKDLNNLYGNKFAEEYKEIAKLEPLLQ